MTVQTHPLVMAIAAEQRQADVLAQADRDRLAQRAQRAGGNPRRTGTGRLAVAAAIVALALLLVAGRATAREPAPQPQSSLEREPAQAAELPGSNTVQKVREAAP